MTNRSSQPPAVTAREREVLALIAEHLTNSQIADELCLSVRTVEAHVSALIRKFQVADRRSLARQASTSAPSRGGPGGWPASLSGFVGRERERRELAAAVAAHRMVTVTGPGGVGKTRLALEVAREVSAARHDGGRFVELAPVTDPEMVMAAVASAVGVAEQPGMSLEQAVAAALASSDAVIVVDNCEHLLEAVRAGAERLLASCPSLHIVATSRARLVAPFEWVYVVPGLSVTSDGGDAVTLFAERVQAAVGRAGTVLPDRRLVAELCRSLDGLALAIELAAARYPSLGLDGLLVGLDHRLQLLTSGPGRADRHRSLRDLIAWSYRLLNDEDRALLDTVSVFASWFDLNAAAVVTARSSRADVADGLARLADQNLLLAAPGQPTRYRALETIRQFGAEQLALNGNRSVAVERHRHWCIEQLTELDAAEPKNDAWCLHLDHVTADVRAAIVGFAPDLPDPAAAGLTERLAALLFLRGRPAESQRHYEQAAGLTLPGQPRGRLLRLAAGAAASRMVGNDTLRLRRAAATEALAANDHAEAAQDLAWIVIYLGRSPGIVAVLPSQEEIDATLEEARALASGSPGAEAAVATAVAASALEANPQALEQAAEAVTLTRAGAHPLLESAALDTLAAHYLARNDLDRALGVIHQREELLATVALNALSGYEFNDHLLMGSEVHLGAGQLTRAATYANALADLACYRDQPHLALARRIKVDALIGDLDGAASQGERFLVSWERAGQPVATNLAVTTYALAMVHGLLGDAHRRRHWLDVTVTLTRDPRSLTDCSTGWAPTLDAMVALDQGRPDEALERLSADIDDPAIWNHWLRALWRPWYAALWAEAAVLAHHDDAGDRLARSRSATSNNPVAATIRQRAADLAASDRAALRTHARTFTDLGCRYQQRRTDELLNDLTHRMS